MSHTYLGFLLWKSQPCAFNIYFSFFFSSLIYFFHIFHFVCMRVHVCARACVLVSPNENGLSFLMNLWVGWLGSAGWLEYILGCIQPGAQFSLHVHNGFTRISGPWHNKTWLDLSFHMVLNHSKVWFLSTVVGFYESPHMFHYLFLKQYIIQNSIEKMHSENISATSPPVAFPRDTNYHFFLN